MDKKNVQKSICRNLFAQNRAALGDLRNFFGDHFARPYMVRGHAPILNPVCGGQCQKGGFPGAACPFWGVSCFRKTRFADFRGSLNRSRTRRRGRRLHCRHQNRSTNGDTFGRWFSAIGRCRVPFQTQCLCKERISLKIGRLFLRMTVSR